MNKLWRTIAASLMIGTTVGMTSCGGEGGNNSDMPPESTQGDTQETGVEGNGYVMPEDTAGTTDTTGTTTGGGTTTGTTSGSTTGTTTAGSTTGAPTRTTNGSTTGR